MKNKNSKIYIFAVFIVLLWVVVSLPALPVQRLNEDDQLVYQVLSSKKITLLCMTFKRDVFYEKNNSESNKLKLFLVNYKNTEELLKERNDNFFFIQTTKGGDTAQVTVAHYKSGWSFRFSFKKINEGWKEIDNDFGKTKFIPSKPYYIYYEILKQKYPDYMNWELFPIPKDSLR